MTAEFAVVLPAVLLVLMVAIGGLDLVAEQVRLQFAADNAARAYGRGDAAAAQSVLAGLPGAAVTPSQRGDLACADATMSAWLGPVPGASIAATACALSDGH